MNEFKLHAPPCETTKWNRLVAMTYVSVISVQLVNSPTSSTPEYTLRLNYYSKAQPKYSC